ncbi:MAG: hypothetical protein UW22_C0011G0001, partial [Candidatus Gottesmanbacteria bacterium GW2011_GWB1_44_11c]
KGVKTKKDMLLAEGVQFRNDSVDLLQSQWNT